MITIHILLDISKRKGKQAIKFGQLKEFNMRNIFLIDCFKKSKFSLSLDQHSKILTDKLRCLPLAFTSSNHFCKKQEEVWNQSPCIKFYMILAKNNYVIYSINDQFSWPHCLDFLKYWAICALYLFVQQLMTLQTLKSKLFFCMINKVRTRI